MLIPGVYHFYIKIAGRCQHQIMDKVPQAFLKSIVILGCLYIKLLDNCIYCPHYSIHVIVGYKHWCMCLNSEIKVYYRIVIYVRMWHLDIRM